MSDNKQLFDMASLSEAAYADFVISAVLQSSTEDIKIALKAKGWSDTQATEFLTHYRVVSQQPNTATGYSATLFERLSDGGAPTGEYVFAQRGTEPFAQLGLDLAVDIGDLVADGLAWSQIVDMYNYWKQLTTPDGQTYQRATLVKLSAIPASGGYIFDTGLDPRAWQIQLTEAISPVGPKVPVGAALEVTGHSLGGHLASAFTRLFPGAASQAYTLNGAGYAQILGSTNIQYVFSQLGGANNFTSAAVQNFRGSAGPDIVTQNSGLVQVGASDQIFIEQGGLYTDSPRLSALAVFGHSATQLTDSAAVYDLFIRLDATAATLSPGQYLPKLLGVFEAGANTKAASLEEVVRALARTFDVDDSPIATNNREALHARIKLIRDDPDFQSAAGQVLIRPQGFDLRTSARTDFGALAALIDLSPFSIAGKDAAGSAALAGIWQSTRSADYAAWQADKTAVMPSNLTDQWIADRSALLQAIITRNQNDLDDQGITDTNAPAGAVTFFDYYDASDPGTVKVLMTQPPTIPGLREQHIIFGNEQANTLNGYDNLLGDHIYGGDGNDTIDGGSGDDYIEGNAGNDSLIGGSGNDTLIGGEGFDTYAISATAGNNTISDSDGQGAVTLNGTAPLGLATRAPGETLYHDTAGNFFAWTGEDLVINDRLTITNFHNKDLGIYLDERDNRPSGGGGGGGGGNGINDYNPRQVNGMGIDPVVLDLNGNGRIETIGSGDSNAYFDFKNNGISARTGWIAPGDGFLAIDSNGNGVIDGLGELFGTATVDGFTDLMQRIDVQHDGMIDAQDSAFAALRVWQDENGDGISQSGELHTLAELGIDQIYLSSTPSHIADQDNLIIATGSFRRGGQAQLLGDVALNVNFAITDSNPNRPLDQNPTLDPDVFNLPWLRGYGAVSSLHIAVQARPELRQELKDLVSRGPSAIADNIDKFLADWTGLTAAQAGKGVTRQIGYTVEDKVWMLGTLTGQETFNAAIEGNSFGTGIPGSPGLEGSLRRLTSNYVEQIYQEFAQRAALAIAIQTKGNDWLPGAYYSLAEDRFVAVNAMQLGASLADKLLAVSSEADASFLAAVLARLTIDGVDFSATTLETAITSSPYAALFDNAINFKGTHVWYRGGTVPLAASTEYLSSVWFQGSEGNDAITGGKYGNYLDGGAGDDTLIGREGNDTLTGGAGNDGLQGGLGNDVYLFKRGFGNDDIWENGGTDTIRFDNDISPSDIRVWRDGRSLFLGIIGSADKIIVHQWESGNQKVERVEFSDGTVWGVPDLIAASLIPTDGNDVLYGTSGDDNIAGLGGDDLLIGVDGNNMFDGGTGNDTLKGNAGDDTYVFSRGFGRDTIVDTGGMNIIRFDSTISPSDIKVARIGFDLKIGIAGTTDQITVQGWQILNDGKIAQVQFADGTIWSEPDLVAASLIGTDGSDYLVATDADVIMNGYGGNDYLIGGLGNDTLDGGTGNDVLQGAAGDNIYLFSRGFGRDVIYGHGTDTIRFDGTISPADIKVTNDGTNLNLEIIGTDDQVSIMNWALEDIFKIGRVQFADGTNWGVADLVAVSMVASNGDDRLYGTSADEVIHGLGGNDTIFGGAGNDTLDGGPGSDSLQGEDGDDVYLFSRGFGQDTIADTSGADTIQFDSTIAPSDVAIYRNSNDLYLGVNGSTDGLLINGWFTSNARKVESVVFADGTTWSVSDLEAKMSTSTEGDDEIFGTTGNDLLQGMGGDDLLVGVEGNDTLNGGAGNDELEGGYGDDVYSFSRGFGQDTISEDGGNNTIRFDDTIAVSDVKVTRDYNNLYLNIVGTTDQITVLYWDPSDGSQIDRVEFADGTSWSIADLATAQFKFNGTNDSDFILGTAGNDVMEGRSGNDYLYGGLGDDVYLFGSGFGHDTIFDQGGTDTIRFDNTIAASDVKVRVDANNLYLGIAGTDDEITVQYWQYDDMTKVERVEFADGTTWSTADLLAASLTATEGDDTLYGTSGDDVILGLGGNDELTGGQGNNTLDGGAGNDTLNGGTGDDTYLFGRGFGQDVLNEFGGTDKIEFDNSIAASDVNVTRDGTNLTLSIVGTNDRITVTNWALSDSAGIEIVQFADGTTWGASELAAAPITSTDDAEVLYGNGGDEVFHGLGGDDFILAGGGNDTIDGGNGNDVLFGGAGNDLYLFSRGFGYDAILEEDGADTIRFNNTISPSDVEASREGTNLTLHIAGTSDTLVVVNYFASDSYKIEQIAFDDGTVWDSTTLNLVGSGVLLGGSEVDTLSSGQLADFIAGGAGNDSITFGSDANVIAFNSGDGNDTISGIAATGNTLSLGGGIAYGNLAFSVSGDNLVLNTGGADSITFNGWYGSNSIHDFSTLQVVEGASPDYDPTSANPLVNKAVEQFDFGQLVEQFDQARTQNSALTSWNLMNGLLSAHLADSDTAALGGDLAYYQGARGSLSGMDLAAALAAVQDSQFGKNPQAVHSWPTISQSATTLR